MKNIISIIALGGLLFSCKQNSSQNITAENTIECTESSDVMKNFLIILKNDNYAISEITENEQLSFKSYKEEFKIDQSISIPKNKFKKYFAKRKNKLENMDDNWYPSFTVSEICFKDETSASKGLEEISKTINSFDLANEKNYDYILQNKTKLIYVSCGASIFKGFAFSYKKQIEELIQKNLKQ